MGSFCGGSKVTTSQTDRLHSTTMPIVPDEWLNVYNNARLNIGPTGATPEQQSGIDVFKNLVASNPVSNQLQDANRYWESWQNQGSHTLGNLAARAAAGEAGYESYAVPTAIAAQMVSAPTIAADQVRARQGADFMNSYQNPYTNDVVKASLADLGNAYNRSLVNSGMAAAAGGAFGGGRHAIREAQMADDYLRNVAGTSANLRSQGFDTAANLGMADAGRVLQGDMANQSANLSAATSNAANVLAASQANAANALSADTFNRNLSNDRQKFDVDAAYRGDEMRANAVKSREANLAMQQGVTTDDALNLIKSGNMTTQQMIDLLNTGTVTFGSETDSLTTSTGTQKKSGDPLSMILKVAAAIAKPTP